MDLISKEIEEYCISHSSIPSKDCEKIHEFTNETENLSHMIIGKMEASFLGFLIRSLKVKEVLEIGTFTGYSALAMAENLPDNGPRSYYGSL